MGSRIAASAVLAALLAAVAIPCGAAEIPFSGCRWESMERQVPGFGSGSSRWRAGTLVIRDEKVLWVDLRDPGRNLIVPLSHAAGHSLSCGGGPAETVCTEWRIRTRREEYRFRDLLSGPNGSPRLIEINDHVRSVLADLPAVQPTDRR